MNSTTVEVRKDNVELSNPHNLTLVLTRCPDDMINGITYPHYCLELRKPNPAHNSVRAGELLSSHIFSSSVREEYHRVSAKEIVVCGIDPTVGNKTYKWTIRNMSDAVSVLKSTATRLGGLPWRVEVVDPQARVGGQVN